jgi:hypothetical protein
VRYVRDDLDDERDDDEFTKLCDKLLELEITGEMVSVSFNSPEYFNSHVVELELTMSEAKLE